MNKAQALETQKVFAIIEEVEASFNFIKEGIRNLNSQKSAVLNNHVSLQLLAAGFERLIKILLLLKELHINGSYPATEKPYLYFKQQFNNGHDIKSMLANLLSYADTVENMIRIPMVVEDMGYLRNDKAFIEFINIITSFSISQRYYYIDTILLSDNSKQLKNDNPFARFKGYMHSLIDGIDLTKFTYEQEEKLMLKCCIVSIEKGARALARFFTHGLGDEGRKYYGDFGNFFLLNDDQLGTMKYLLPKHNSQTDYQPMKKYSFQLLLIHLQSKSKIVKGTDHDDWPFTVNEVKVYNFKNHFYLVEIKDKIFALNGSAIGHFKIPNYFASEFLKPKEYATYLIDIAKQL